MRRTICFLLIIAVLFSAPGSWASAAEDADYSGDIALLKALGILDSVEDFSSEAPLTKYSATVIAMKMIAFRAEDCFYDGEFSDIAKTDYNGGLIREAVRLQIAQCANGALFAKNSKVNYTAAIELIFNALNYKAFASAQNTGGYIAIAQEYKMTLGKKAEPGALTNGEFAKLAALALEIPLVALTALESSGKKAVYTVDDGTCALNRYFNTYKIKGYVTGTSVTSLYSKETCGRNSFEIGGVTVAFGGGLDENDLLGRQIEAYYQTSDGVDCRYIHHTPVTSQKVLVLAGDDILGFSKNTYRYENEREKVRTIPVAANCAVIYNGLAVTDEDADYLTDDLFCPENGFAELLAGKSGEYEVVKIRDYDTYVVKNIYSSNKMIVDKYESGNLVLDEAVRYLSVRDSEQNTISFDALEKLDVLSIARSLNGACVFIVACGDAVEGIYTGYTSDETVSIEGETFPVSKQLLRHGERIPKIGENVTVYLDAFGKVVAMELAGQMAWNIGLLLKSDAEKQGLSKRAMCRILGSDSAVKTVKIAEKVWIDEIRYSDSGQILDALQTNEVIRYKLDKAGEINRIDTATVEESNDSLHLVAKGSYTYRSTQPLFYDEEFDVVVPKSDAIVFVNPMFLTTSANGIVYADESDFADDDYFTAGLGFLVNAVVYNLKAYKIGTEGLACDVFVCGYYNYALYTKTEQSYVVKKVSRALGSDNQEIIRLLCANVSGEKTLWDYSDRSFNPYVNSGLTLENVDCGDIIRANATADGKILFLFKVFDYQDRAFYQRVYASNVASVAASGALPKYEGYEYNRYPDRDYFVYANALDISDGYITVRPVGTERKIIFKATDNVLVYGHGALRRGSQTDILVDDTGEHASTILIDSYLSTIRLVIIFE